MRGERIMQLSRDEYLRISQLQPETGDAAYGTVLFAVAPGHRALEVANGAESRAEEARRIAAQLDENDANDVAREQIVASLRARVEAGTYHVSGEQIAEMMVRRFLADRVRY